MKDKYNVEKKKIDVTSVPPSDWRRRRLMSQVFHLRIGEEED